MGELEGSGEEGRTGDEWSDERGRGEELGKGDAGNVDEEGITGDEEGGDDGGIGESLPDSRNPNDNLFLCMEDREERSRFLSIAGGVFFCRAITGGA